MRLFNELKRRNVIRTALAYAAASWLILQVVDVVLPTFEARPWVLKTITTSLLAGFPVTVVLAWFFEFTPQGVRLEDEAGHDRTRSKRATKRFDLIVIGMLAAAVILLVVDNYLSSGRAVVRPDRAPTVAVLPFVNMSSDPEQAFFSDGISEEILNSLATVRQLRVAGRTSSFAFKGRYDDLRLIGDTLSVAHVLNGSVRKSGTTLRITAQLTAVDDGSQVLLSAFEGKLTDVFAILDEIAAAILRELKVELPAPQRSPTATPTATRAYDLYLLARQRIHARTQLMLESAAQLLDQAIELDSGYAPAYAQRGIAELLLVEGNHGDLRVQDALPRSRTYLDKSVMLDADLAEGWAGLGLYYLTSQNEYQKAIEVLQKAVAINPGLIDANNWLMNAFSASGNVEAARALAQRMARQDPLDRPGFTSAVHWFNRFGEHDKAFALIERVKPFMPDDASVLASTGSTYIYMGNVVAAYPFLEETYARMPDNAQARFLFGRALTGTGQFERLALEGYGDQKIAGLDRLGRTARAADLARRMAGDGALLPLLQHFNRTEQSGLAVAYIDERWPDLDAFEVAYPHNVFGHEEMTELALAYQRTADPRFRDALQRVSAAFDRLEALRVNNWVFERNRAVYLALAADTERALESLASAIDSGYRDIYPLAATRPAFESLSAQPRFTLLEQRMRDYQQRDREQLGLPP